MNPSTPKTSQTATGTPRMSPHMVSPRACIAFSALETARIFGSVLGRLLHALKRKFGVASPQRESGKKVNPAGRVLPPLPDVPGRGR
jgi:hypothetical protein